MWGSCFWLCTPACLRLLLLLLRLFLPPPASSHTTCSHTTYSHTTCSHTTYSHTTRSHTTCPHTTCSHTTYSHTTYSHTVCPHTTCSHTTCSHTTYSRTTCSHTHTACPHTTRSHTTCSHTQLVHTQLAHTQRVHTQLTHTQLVHTQLVHTQLAHTHLIRTIFANSDVECIVRAKTLQLYLTGMGRWHALRKYRKGTIAIANARSKKLEADPSLVTRTFNWARSFPSDIDLKFIGSSLDWNLWKKRQWTNDIKWNGMVALGLATSHCRNDMKNSRYVDDRPHRYHRWHTGVFVGASPVCIPGTPCNDC